MEALIERRRIVRDRLTDGMGKVDGFFRLEEPPMRELSNLIKTLTEQNNFLSEINREVESTVEIEKLESEMFGAFDFEATVMSAIVELEMKITETTTNRQALIMPLNTRISPDIRQRRENTETENENNNTLVIQKTRRPEQTRIEISRCTTCKAQES